MIDIIKAKKELKEYVKKYDINDPKIKLKIAHIERVSIIAKKMAESLNLPEEDVKLAELIGLLHDIGRFEQVKLYGTFIDRLSIDHGKLGSDILFKEGLIRNFIKEDKYDEIINLAITNHNKDRKDIDKDVNKEEDLHIKLIRDSDKVDILYILVNTEEDLVWESKNIEEEKFTDEIYKSFIKEHGIVYKNKKTRADSIIGQFAYAFDFNFDYGLKNIYDNKYYEKIYKRIKFKDKETQERFDEIYKITNNYIEKRLNGENYD